MSDAGSVPPPPPPNLSPPPGYAAYAPDVGATVPLRRISGLRTAISILLGVYTLGSVIALAVTPSVVDAAERFLDNELTDDEFIEELNPFVISGVLSGLATVAIVVLSIIWLFRITSNHRAIGRRTSWSPGWAVGGWFVPPLVVYAVPMLVLRESWKASAPDVPPGDDRWRQSTVNPLIYVWWVLYGLAPVVFLIAGLRVQVGTFSQDTEDFADFMRDRVGVSIAQSIVGIAAAVAWFLLVRALTARHATLTGEATRR